MQAVPPWVRFVLAIVITAGTTMLLVRLFHRRKLALNAKDEAVKGALFIVVQASNPYAGATAVEWPLLG